MINTIINLCI